MKKTLPCLLLLAGLAFPQIAFSQTKVPICLYFASHNETNDQTFHGLDYSKVADYAIMRAYVQQLCDTVIAYHARYEMMLESNFILGCLKNENAATNPNDIIEWADNQPNIEVEPHNHFKASGVGANPYNYADLCHLLDSCGLSSTPEVMGGFIWRSFTMPVALSEDWTQWQNPKAGYTFPFYTWKPTLLWGGGSPNHIDDYEAYGVWKPQTATTAGFGVHDPGQTLVNFGNGCGDDFIIWDTTTAQLLAYRIMNFADSVQAHFADTPNAFFNMKVMMNFRNLPAPGYVAKLGQVLRTIQPYIDEGKIQYKGILETYQYWQSLHPDPTDYFATTCDHTVTISNATPTIVTAVHETGADPQTYVLTAYPNPVSNILMIHTNRNVPDDRFTIQDMWGRPVLSGVFTNSDAVVDVTNFAAGFYVVRTGGVALKVLKW